MSLASKHNLLPRSQQQPIRNDLITLGWVQNQRLCPHYLLGLCLAGCMLLNVARYVLCKWARMLHRGAGYTVVPINRSPVTRFVFEPSSAKPAGLWQCGHSPQGTRQAGHGPLHPRVSSTGARDSIPGMGIHAQRETTQATRGLLTGSSQGNAPYSKPAHILAALAWNMSRTALPSKQLGTAASQCVAVQACPGRHKTAAAAQHPARLVLAAPEQCRA